MRLPDPFRQIDRNTLDCLNFHWQQKMQAFRQSKSPWWVSGMVVTPAIRQAYEHYLPVGCFLDDWIPVLHDFLPDRSWLPDIMQKRISEMPPVQACMQYASLPDLWQTWPEHLAGHVGFGMDELLAFACASASPARHGSLGNRYPEQVSLLLDIEALPDDCLRVIDIGCGTGQGTLGILNVLSLKARHVIGIGITKEPLEVWMASNQQLPHMQSMPDDLSFPDLHPHAECTFSTGDICTRIAIDPADLVICNGLLGGPALHEEHRLLQAARTLASTVKVNGYLLIGNCFHAGHEEMTASVLHCLGTHGFECNRSIQSSFLFQRTDIELDC